MRASIGILIVGVLSLALATPAEAQLSLGRRLDAPRASAPSEAPTPAEGDGAMIALVAGGAVALTVAVIGVGVWIYAFTRIQDINADPAWDEYRASVPPGTRDACAAAAGDTPYGPAGAHAHAGRICSEGGTLEMVEWISLGTAIAAAAVAIGLFAASEDARERPQLTLAPALGPGLAGASLTLRF